MEPQIRRATPDDAAVIARLVVELGYPAVTPDVMHERLAAFGSEGHVVAVAAVDGGIAGWISGERRLTIEAGVFHEITGLVVGSGYRRRGVGRALVAWIEAWARADGGSTLRVRSNVVRPESHVFYEANGYGRIKTQHAYAKVIA